MCGRFKLTTTPEALDKLFPSLFDDVELKPRCNIAPTQNLPRTLDCGLNGLSNQEGFAPDELTRHST
jgi:putative SOS response-associated peptidase YedK